MGKVKLEDILEKLEKMDIRCWNIITKKRGFDIIEATLTAENSGLKFYLDEDCLSIEDLETNYSIGYDYRFDKQYKAFKEVMEKFYEKTYTTLREYQKGKIEEKLKNFLTD